VGPPSDGHPEQVGGYVAEGGEFTRESDYITSRITADGRDGYLSSPAAIG
jgi:putative glutathione S-transferase